MLWALLAISLGEGFSIYGELRAAKEDIVQAILFVIIGSLFLVFGYWQGVKSGSIWQVTAISIGSILIIEPTLIAILFREFPSRNALIGCLLGAVGMIVANLENK